MAEYETIIGLEVHVELKTKSKMFCGCPADHFGKLPNTQTCPVCLGLPGALPVPNRKAVEWTVMLGLALGCRINAESKFDRKNYFYPDLPKGFQISQYDQPVAEHGELAIAYRDPETHQEVRKTIRIRRVHLEEDTGKLQHAEVRGERCTLVDFNRSGVPLVEIVTEPDVRGSEEAKAFLKKLHQIVRYLDISDADMEKGTMRMEPNISVRRAGETELPNYKVELKNINSFMFAKKGIDYEVARQIKLLEKGERPRQETRGWSEKKHATVLQRTKEEAHDYRYYPEPDIPPMTFPQGQLAEIQKGIPELPDAKVRRFTERYGVAEYDAMILADTRESADYFERAAAAAGKSGVSPKQVGNWIVNKKIDIAGMTPEELTDAVAAASAVTAIDETKLAEMIAQVFRENEKAVADYRKGKTNAIGALLAAMLKYAGPSADKQLILKRLTERLSQG